MGSCRDASLKQRIHGTVFPLSRTYGDLGLKEMDFFAKMSVHWRFKHQECLRKSESGLLEAEFEARIDRVQQCGSVSC